MISFHPIGWNFQDFFLSTLGVDQSFNKLVLSMLPWKLIYLSCKIMISCHPIGWNFLIYFHDRSYDFLSSHWLKFSCLFSWPQLCFPVIPLAEIFWFIFTLGIDQPCSKPHTTHVTIEIYLRPRWQVLVGSMGVLFHADWGCPVPLLSIYHRARN